MQANKPTYIELFAGAGGLSLGLDRAGWHCLGHAEVDDHARAVLRHRWPDTPLYGDVATLDGTGWRGVTMISGGSPCQDLSIAGRREGLSGRRSGLFFHQVRLWRESEAPLLLWENVVGALSSNQGKDFARILSTIVGEPLAVPRGANRERLKWPKAGSVVGTTGVSVAWRVLDLRRFGIPQRRRRVFIIASRSGFVCPRAVLLDAARVRGDSDASATARQADSGAVAVESGTGGALAVNISNSVVSLVVASEPLAFKLRGGVEIDAHGDKAGEGFLGVTGEVFTLGTAPDQYLFDARGNGDGQTYNTLPGDHQNRVTDYTAIVVPTITMGAHPAAPGLNGQDAAQFADAILRAQPTLPRPRRLLPIECERLMSWPDDWTADGIDERGRRYALKDTPRYRLCGNGVGSIVAEWIGRRIIHHLPSEEIPSNE